MLVSIIIPVYNVEKYLSDCLESVINQTYENIEIICVNDGSTDNSKHVLEQYCYNNGKIAIINQENGGLSAARNTGLKVAKGDIIYFLDSDDMIAPDAISVIVNEMTTKQLDVLLFAADDFYDDDIDRRYNEGIIWSRNKAECDVICSGVQYFENAIRSQTFLSSIPLMAFSKKVIEGKYFSEGYIHEDLYYSFMALMNANRVECINEKLFMRRHRSDSITTKAISYRNVVGRIVAYLDVVDLMKNAASDECVFKCAELYSKKILDGAFGQYVSNELDDSRINMKEDKYLEGITKILSEFELANNICDYPADNRNPVVLIGAGKIGKRALAKIGSKKVICFADNDCNKDGSFVEGVPVRWLGGFTRNEFKEYDFVISCGAIYQLYVQLEKMGIENIYRCTPPKED